MYKFTNSDNNTMEGPFYKVAFLFKKINAHHQTKNDIYFYIVYTRE